MGFALLIVQQDTNFYSLGLPLSAVLLTVQRQYDIRPIRCITSVVNKNMAIRIVTLLHMYIYVNERMLQ